MSCSNCNGCQKKTVEEIVEEFNGDKTALIACLQRVQKEYGYISKESIKTISDKLQIAESEIYGVVSFYSQFETARPADNTIEVCLGTACYVLGANDILEKICSTLKIKPNVTSEDGKWRVSTTRCLGCCGLAPVITINGKVYGRVKMNQVEEILKEYM